MSYMSYQPIQQDSPLNPPLLNFPLPVLGFCGFSGVGKTTLLTQLIPLLTVQGLRLGLIKRTHHDFEIDQPGKDSYRLRQAGAQQMLIASAQRHALMVETPGGLPVHLAQLLPNLHTATLDLILVEGFKNEAITKIEIHRPSLKHPLLAPGDPTIIAIASDVCPALIQTELPVLDLNRVDTIADFITNFYLGLSRFG